MSKRRQKGEEFKQEEILQAVVIADSFNVRFAPITKSKPRALLPLTNVPLLEHTLEFLSSAGIQETIVYCCSHADQIKAYLNKSKWLSASSPMDIIVIVSEDCLSMGDALRDLDAKSLISNDFVLVNGDVISNVQLKPIIEAHRARRLKDKTVLMTMLLKKAPPGHMTRCKEDHVVMAIRPDNKQVLSFQKVGASKKFDFPLSVFTDNRSVELHYDLQDTQISVCSPHVPALFTDNFDFLSRDDFVRGILIDEEILGHTIHIHELEEEYAARVSNLVMYDAVSQDVLNRWVYPIVPDNVVSDKRGDKYSYGRHNIYLHHDVTLARDCILEENVVVGKGTTINERTRISDSVIGQGCTIGADVKLDGAYIWDNVVIEDGCELKSCIVDNDVRLLAKVTVQGGCVLAAGVTVGPDVTLAPGTKLMLSPPENDFEDDVQTTEVDTTILGARGQGYVYLPEADSDDDDDADVAVVTDTWGVSPDVVSDADDDQSESSEASTPERNSPIPDEPKLFFGEVMSTLERARDENIGRDNMVLEINSVKHAYGIQINEVNQLLTKAIMELPLAGNPDIEPVQYMTQIKNNFQKFLLALLRNYIRNEESQMDCMESLEDFSLNNPVGQKTLVNVIHFLYEHDLLSEDVITEWHGRPSSSAENPAAHKRLRESVNPFIRWLNEAEEESEDEDDDSD